MPELFGLKEITLGNAVALLVMVNVVKNSVTSNFSLDKK
jgi:hypothetical protein